MESEIQLTDLRSEAEPTGIETQALPAADDSIEAWLFLAACFMIEALVWGFPFAFGLFQQYYVSHTPFDSSSNIAIIGTCAMGVMYLGAPLNFGALRKWPPLGRISIIVGLALMCIALAASSFATEVWHLIFTQGVLYAIGGGLAYCPTIIYVDEWFVRRKGFAFGVMWAGTGVAGVVLPLVLQWLLNAYGFRTALRVWTVTLFVLTFPLIKYLKPRIPPSYPNASNRVLFDLKFLKEPYFLVLQGCNIVEAVGYFLPSIYLPIFAETTLKASSIESAATVITMNVASVLGCVVMGALIDRYHVTTCILISSIGATVGALLLWGLSTSLPLLYVFCVVYGLFAGSFTTTWTGVIRLIRAKTGNSADTGMIFSFLAFGRGVGNIISGPLSEQLIKGQPWLQAHAMAYGSGYGPLIAFTGVSAFLGGASFFFRRSGLYDH